MSVEADVIVVGAGPGGACCARAASAQGARVVVLERARLPRAKACGGVLPAPAAAWVEDRVGDLPAEVWASPAWLDSARLHLDAETHLLCAPPWPAVRVNRKEFDQALLAECGAEVRDGTAVEQVVVEGEGARAVLGDGSSVRARWVVLASGATSGLLPRRTRRHLAFVGRARYPGRPPMGRQYLLLEELSQAWVAIDPDGDDGLSITTVVKDPRIWKEAQIRAVTYALGPLGLEVGRERGAEFGWIPRRRPDLGKPPVLRVGDAAGLGSALGLGLEDAIRSGFALGDALTEDDPWPAYKQAMAELLQRRTQEARTWKVTRGHVETLDPDASLADALGSISWSRRWAAGSALRNVLAVLDKPQFPPQGFPVR